MSTSATMDLQATGYDRGETFKSVVEARTYFTVANMAAMFGAEDGGTLSQDRLDDMADWVIRNRKHCDFWTDRTPILASQIKYAEGREAGIRWRKAAEVFTRDVDGELRFTARAIWPVPDDLATRDGVVQVDSLPAHQYEEEPPIRTLASL